MKIRSCAFAPNPSFVAAKAASRNFANPHRLPESISSIALGVSGPITKWRTDFLFDYQVFPPSILRFEAEWQHAGRKMAVDDVILQRLVMPPIGFGLCLEFAVRVNTIIKEDERLGFAYETLTGHVESGVAEFYFEEIDGQLHFTIHTFSQPGHWAARIAKHVFTLPYQRWCTQRALAHVRRNFIAHHPAAHVTG